MLNEIFDDFKSDVIFYTNLVCSDKLPLKKNLSSKDLPTNRISHSQWKQIIYKNASEIVRSQIKKANHKRFKHYQKLYHKCSKENRRQSFLNRKFNELNLKPIHLTKFFTIPNLENITITLDQRLIDFTCDATHFDEFVRIKSPYFYENKKRAICIKLPIKHHKHSLKFKRWNRKNSIRLRKQNENYFLDLIYEKEELKKPKVQKSIAFDQGYKKLLSDNLGNHYGQELFEVYQKISRKEQGSKAFKGLLVHRDNEINRVINSIDFSDIDQIVIENLKNVKHKSKLFKTVMNKVQRWSYTKVVNKLERFCEENGVHLTKVDPAYTSQTCNNCGVVDKDSRSGERFHCKSCGYSNDADTNAALNIHRLGVYSLQCS
jgi:IS605 OrfB family transposase